jgi:hypothetical protein
METVTTCPLGHTCEKAVDGKIERCAWYIKMAGSDPQTGAQIEESRCSMAWQPLLMLEANGLALNGNASIQSLRNETIKRQNIALEAIKNDKIPSHS